MEVITAQHLIQSTVSHRISKWADIGAGTGLFTLALAELLPAGSTIYSVDKSPHSLYKLPPQANHQIKIIDADYNRPIPDLPALDGMIMANALHYTDAPQLSLQNLIHYLKPGAPFLLFEYELAHPIPTWIPYPIPYASFESICSQLPLSHPEIIAQHPSMYGSRMMYLARTYKRSSF